MRRRPLFTLCSAASALLFAALLLGWAGAQLGEQRWLRFTGHALLLYGADGPEVAAARRYFFDPPTVVGDAAYLGPGGLVRLLRAGSLGTAGAGFAGVEVYWETGQPASAFRAVVVPTVYPLALAAVLPAVWAARRARGRRRAAAGRCVACDYDLRASPGRCPECGTLAARKGET